MISCNAEYVNRLRSELDAVESIARQARSRGLDPAPEPEILSTTDLADRVEKLVGPPGIADRIRRLQAILQREQLALKIAEEVALDLMVGGCEAALEQALRTAAAILDAGLSAAPIEGIHKVRISAEGTTLSVYYASPIRALGDVEMGLTAVIADHLRRTAGLERYRASELEARRVIEEVRLYEQRIGDFRYKATDEDLLSAITHLPVDLNGIPSDPLQAPAFRGIPGVQTNRLRTGALVVLNDGIIGSRKKMIPVIEELGISGWDWLIELPSPTGEAHQEPADSFLDDLVAGQPVFSLPGAPGGFRLRYGRGRNTGLGAVGVHPATMRVLGDFIATGTQLRTETPRKAAIAMPVDSIEGPLVKLRDGSVVRVADEGMAAALAKDVDTVLFIGDLLVDFAEFLANSKPLSPAGFVEEWWAALLRNVAADQLKATGLAEARVRELAQDPWQPPSPEEALAISKATGIPLHPRYTYLWASLSPEECLKLRESLRASKAEWANNRLLAMVCDVGCKPLLERLWVPHRMTEGGLIIDEAAPILYTCLALDKGEIRIEAASALDLLERLSGVKVWHKAPTFLGVRMGRPEKAEGRRMNPAVHSLFPIGLSGGRRRELSQAQKRTGPISVEVVRRLCPQCGITCFPQCPSCGAPTQLQYYCMACRKPSASPTCKCGSHAIVYEAQLLDIKALAERATANLGMATVPAVKCLKDLVSATRTPELLEKGILRAKHGISVFRDGTARFDCTNAPLTHFRPSEISATCENLRALGYVTDHAGRPLEESGQLCELMIHDIVLPKKGAEYFLRVARFLDELLKSVYHLQPFYNLSGLHGLIGHIVFGLSPHTSVAVLGRIVGFTDSSVCYAHPLWHAAKRRNCDGDVDSISLALDVLINFSRAYLPERTGGLIDAPLLLATEIRPAELARQAVNLEATSRFPTSFYEKTRNAPDPKTVLRDLPILTSAISEGRGNPEVRFTHEVTNINSGNHESSYKKPESMLEKMAKQLDLAEMLHAVKASEVAAKVLSAHLMRDITGNLKAFSTQSFRCERCNAKFRRIPLQQKCLRCGGKVSLTVYRGSIEKYIRAAYDLVTRYDLEGYNKQRLDLIKREIESLFSKGETKVQRQLADFV